jgi:hypothetical protein
MEILPANLRDLGGLRRVEQACFLKDAWPLLDLFAVLTWPEIIRLKAVENDQMIGFIAGDRALPSTWPGLRQWGSSPSTSGGGSGGHYCKNARSD